MSRNEVRLKLDSHDEELVQTARDAIRAAVESAANPVAVAKRIVTEAMRQRNRGRNAARRRYPFKGLCEASGEPLSRVDAVLDEVDAEVGYEGRLRWVCPKANNSGKQSCGKC